MAVDPSTGAGAYFATDVLQPLRCYVSGRRGFALHIKVYSIWNVDRVQLICSVLMLQ